MITNLPRVIEYLYPAAIVRVDYRAVDNSDGNGPILMNWNTAKLGPQPSQATLEAAEASPGYAAYWSQSSIDARANAITRAEAITAIDNNHDPGWKSDRAVAGLTIDEINSLRQWITSFKAAVAASTNYATLKSSIAALPNLPDRTLAQAKTALQNKVNSGVVD